MVSGTIFDIGKIDNKTIERVKKEFLNVV